MTITFRENSSGFSCSKVLKESGLMCLFHGWKWKSTSSEWKLNDIFVLPTTDDDCRNIIFKHPMPNMTMKNHAIKSVEVPNEGSCRVMCYMEPNCVSINIGPLREETKNASWITPRRKTMLHFFSWKIRVTCILQSR